VACIVPATLQARADPACPLIAGEPAIAVAVR
jgi:hypothetical protein